MKNIIISCLAVFAGLIAFMFSLLMLIPITLAALLFGRRLRKTGTSSSFFTRTQRSTDSPSQHTIIDGEYEEVSRP